MSDSLDARASYSGYIVFGVMWIPIALLFVFVAVSRNQYGALAGTAIAFSIWLGFALWLAGFRIVIANGKFRYRDGLYRWHECQLDEIESAQAAWVGWDVGTKIIKIPRYTIEIRGREDSILINTKPFTRDALRKLNEILKPMRQGRARKA